MNEILFWLQDSDDIKIVARKDGEAVGEQENEAARKSIALDCNKFP
jgi:hypothetical protein